MTSIGQQPMLHLQRRSRRRPVKTRSPPANGHACSSTKVMEGVVTTAGKGAIPQALISGSMTPEFPSGVVGRIKTNPMMLAHGSDTTVAAPA